MQTVQGGDINDTYRLDAANAYYFIKINSASQFPDMFKQEAAGLQLLGQAQAIETAKTLWIGQEGDDAYLILAYIHTGVKGKKFWEDFGRELASLHQRTSSHFGLENSNYIGSLVQYNRKESKWTTFYIEQRLRPQLDLAIQQERIDRSTILKFEQLFKVLESICPEEKPSLIHGDLWSGNYMVGQRGQPILIDPAVAYASREMDLAMMQLFGGFDQQLYAAYNEVYPLLKDWKNRIPLYQIYYLMVHVNLFGGSYLSSVQQALKNYV
ncbi:MAG: fructosamine kinase family protein [Aureispira sp.]|nr:fructosamine kinase family protein [Aureispira sp.]